MSLRFIIGTAGTGKTHLCLDEIITAQELGVDRQIFIVPEQFTSQSERDLILRSPRGAILSAEVLSFGRLAHQVFSRQGLGSRIPLGDIGKSMALQKILMERKDSILYFKNALNKSGFIDQLGLTISEFFQYRIAPETLLVQAKEEGLSQGIRDKLTDLGGIYQAYQTFLEKDYITGDETLGILATRLNEENGFGATEFWLDGFYGFTPQEFAVIGGLCKRAKNVTITLPMDEESFSHPNLPISAPFYEPSMTKNTLLEMAALEHIPLAPPVFLKKNFRGQTEALRDLEKNYFQGYYKKCPLAESVQLISCPTRQDEINYAAGMITHLVREGGLRYQDMAMVTNGLGIYEKSLRGILREYDIPCFIDSRREITSHPLISMVTALFQILVYDFPYESVFSYLKSGLTHLTQEEVDVLENYALAYGIKGYKWKKATWQYGIKREGEEVVALMNDLREKFMAPFAPFLALGKKSLPLNDLIRLVFDHLAQLDVPERLSLWSQTALEEGALSRGEEHRQIWQMLLQVLEKATEILGDTEMTLEEGTRILAAGLAKCTMGVIPPTADCLLVGDIERSRLPEIKYLFVLGVNEGVLPAPAQPQGIFSEVERQALESKGMTLAPGGKRRAFEEQFLIYRGLTRPSLGLFLTFANGDEEGKSLFLSPLLDRLCRMDEKLKFQAYEGFALEKTVPTAAFHLLGKQLRSHTQETPMSPLWQDIYSFFATAPTWKNRAKLLTRGLNPAQGDAPLSPKTAKALYGKTIFSSVSRLERFAACPFSFFVEYGLKAKERRLYQLHTPDLGLLFHEVLELFSKQLVADGVDWKELTPKQTEFLIHQAVEEAAPRLGDEILLDSAANQYLIQRLKRISTRAAWTLVRHLQNGDFSPIGYELGFGNQEALPPIVLELAEGNQLILSGKIDRVDLLDRNGNHYIKIIDYKSGTKVFNFQDIYYGLQLQLLIYMDAYLKHHETPLTLVKPTEPAMATKPGGVFYFRITDPSISLSHTLTAQEIEEALYEKMQMSGLILENKDVIQGLDHIFTEKLEGNASAIVPVGYTKKGEPAAISYLANDAQYEKLLAFVVERAKEIGCEMQQGLIAPSPYRKGSQTPCPYCHFDPICRAQYEGAPPYRDLKKISKQFFWENLMHEEDEENEEE